MANYIYELELRLNELYFVEQISQDISQQKGSRHQQIFISFASFYKCLHANLRQNFFEAVEGLSISIKFDESFFVFGLTRS